MVDDLLEKAAIMSKTRSPERNVLHKLEENKLKIVG